MAVYRKGQGKIVRISSFVLLASLAFFSYTGLSRFLSSYGMASPDNMFQFGSVNVSIAQICGGVCCFLILFMSYRWTFKKEKAVDFLVDVESEMKKVVWPINPEGRNLSEKTKELRVSSLVVVGVVLFMAYALFLFDLSFRGMMGMILRI